jgi:hypothetical protein
MRQEPSFGPIAQKGKASFNSKQRQDPEFLQQSHHHKLFTPTNSPRTAQDADAQLRKVGAGMYMSSRLPNGFDLRT